MRQSCCSNLTQVIFLEVYDREAARQKLLYLVMSGLHAYFNHKAEEYGVYFFDPRYYQVSLVLVSFLLD